MSRFLTTLVQLFLFCSVVILARAAWPMLKEDWQEIKNDLQK
jgi:hypothetical protein